MPGDLIQIRGARQNNLKGVDVDLPRGRLIAITGVSGSGKSSLAFDTLFREGQRRFLETLSAYARQFLGRMEKPDVDHVEGLSPAIAVDQKAVPRGPRSTVGTLTEVHDHLRVLYARAGTARCPDHGTPLSAQTPEAIVQAVLERYSGEALHVLAPLVRDRKGQHRAMFEDLARRGFVRVRVDGVVQRIEEVGELERYKRHKVELVVDRIKVSAEIIARLREAIGQALEHGNGDLIVQSDRSETAYSTLRACPTCGIEAPPLEPRLFSFNSPHGACATCDGLGTLRRPSEALVVRDPTLSIRAGALAVTRASGGALLFPRVDFDFLAAVGEAFGFDLDTPWQDMEARARRIVLRGSGEERFEDEATWNGKRYKGSVRWQRRYKGVLPAIEEAWEKGGRRTQLERFLGALSCPDCEGSRLNRFARAVTVGDAPIAELLGLPIEGFALRIAGLELTPREGQIAAPLLAEIRRRTAFLEGVGLAYLTLDRAADTLSGGEAQRIRLAAQLGAGLQGVMYVLDEPSIGLHSRDHGKLLNALKALRDQGNTVVVVEHDEATLRAADHVVDVGPGAGRHGGRIVAQGTPAEVARADSPTGRMLRGELAVPAPSTRRPGNGKVLRLVGARGFNLKGIDIEIPLGAFTAVSGVSGSGKSTLIERTLVRALARRLGRESADPAPYDRLLGAEHVEDMVVVDAAPIGRTPRSNPATYTGAFGPIRELFAGLPESKLRGWSPGRFSFNVEGGRCEACQGAGAKLIELQFLAPVTVPCEECGGHRFQAQTLDVRFKGLDIAQVLALTAEDALEVFADLPKIAQGLRALVEVGVGYLTLGQPSTTLSGGEAQRVKLAKYLQKNPRAHTLFLLDEPTTGLHGQDVARLVGALQRLVDRGHSVVVIEHHLDVLRAADRLIDLGPEGGVRGGELLASGSPEDVMANPRSATGAALRAEKSLLDGEETDSRPGPIVPPPDAIRVFDARTHNLKGVNVTIPRDRLTVITGPSGSGKSSLALDTIYTAGRQRFVESLSTYARQFLASRDRPPVERIEGLGPAVAVEARTSTGHPRSTVATTTELHDHLRVLWARAGTRHCPEHGEKLERRDASALAKRILADFAGAKGSLLAPWRGAPAAFPAVLETWRQAGFARVLIDGTEQRIESLSAASAAAERIDLVIDRLNFEPEIRSRLAEAIEQAEAVAEGRVSVLIREAGGRRAEYSTRGACTVCGFYIADDLEPRHFSFNTHVGACPACDGLGQSWQCDGDLLIESPDLALITAAGEPSAIGGKLGRYLTKGKGFYEQLLRTVAKVHRIELGKPFAKLSEEQRRLVLVGEGANASYDVVVEKSGETFEITENFSSNWPGLCGHVDRWHQKSEDPEWRGILEKVMTRKLCQSCAGERLAPAPRAVVVGRKRLPQVLAMPVGDALSWLQALKLPAAVDKAVGAVVIELCSRLKLLDRVGLDYLALDRGMSTLSGGEARRVRLSAALGSQLVGVVYVLDEPTVGLHPRDIDRLAGALTELAARGNTVLVVEHDEEVMRRADHLIDMGPGAGRLGGQVVAAGTPLEIEQGDSPTGRALRGEFALQRPEPDPTFEGEVVGVIGASLNNLQNLSLEVRYGELTGICGPSGSGKSTLVLDTLVPAVAGEPARGRWKRVVGARGGGRRVVLVDASPLGRSPSSIPATAVGLMEPLRELFVRLPEARVRGFTASNFSFNSPRGRCPACEGKGVVQVEMQFLADLWLVCEECEGKRYRPEVLEVRYRGQSIADILAQPADAVLELFDGLPGPSRVLRTLCEVGLGYLPLGQSSTTLSGGEAQRVKLAAELLDADAAGRTLLVLDEPSTGLHASDVVHLYTALRRLVARGDAVVLIEHHTGLLAACDRLIELGPGGGAAGGRRVASGSPAELAANPESPTGPFLRAHLERSAVRAADALASTAAPALREPDGAIPARAPRKPATSGRAAARNVSVPKTKPAPKTAKKRGEGDKGRGKQGVER